MKEVINMNVEVLLASVMYEPNDDKTRKTLASHIGDYFNTLVNDGKIKSFTITCDDTNNTVDIINDNALVIEYTIVNLDDSSFTATGKVSRANPKIIVL